MGNFKKISSVFFLFIFSFSYCAPVADFCTITLFNEQGKMISLNAELADTPSKRETGLMHRNSMDENYGMLFIFNEEQKLNFWMKNTLIPLDIAYIDKNGVINEIYHMKPLDVSVIYNSIKPAKFALEVNSGWFSRQKIKIGSKIEFNGCLSKQNSLIKR